VHKRFLPALIFFCQFRQTDTRREVVRIAIQRHIEQLLPLITILRQDQQRLMEQRLRSVGRQPRRRLERSARFLQPIIHHQRFAAQKGQVGAARLDLLKEVDVL
jgi:hypothetical protein